MKIYNIETNEFLDLVVGAPDYPDVGQVIFGNWKVVKVEKDGLATMKHVVFLSGKVWVEVLQPNRIN